jgi:hypothetical protein
MMAFEEAFARISRDMAKNQHDFLRRNEKLDKDFLARYRGLVPEDDEDDASNADDSAQGEQTEDQGVTDGGTNKPGNTAAGDSGQAQ